jgi:predicted permease
MATLGQFSGRMQNQNECRKVNRARVIKSFCEDLRYAVRNLRRDPFLALAVTVMLGVCIGVNTTVLSVANSILIRPLRYPNSDRIDWISERSGPAQQDLGAVPDYFALREQNRIFEDVAAFVQFTMNWTGIERPEPLEATAVSSSFFHVMGTQPLLGRYLTPDEEGPKAPPVAVLSYAFWRTSLGGDPHILGKTIELDRLPRNIVGVMPQGFDFPRGSQFWVPQEMLDKAEQSFPLAPARPIAIVSILARRKLHVTPQQTATEMNRLTFQIRALYSEEFRKRAFRSDVTIGATSLQEHLTGDVRPAINILMGAVALVLLIACANIANLLLTRAGSRQRELAVRLALGSGRRRIICQMLTESLILAIPGGLAGIGLAWLAVDVLDTVKPAILVRYPEITLDWRVLAFTCALMLVTSLLFGVAPALYAAGINIHDVLKSASLTHSRGRGATRLRKVLVVTEMGISLVLLIGAGLLARSFLHLAHTELGFASDHLLTFRIIPSGPLDRDYGPFYSEVLNRLQHLPLLRSVSVADAFPLSNEEFVPTGRIRVIGRPLVPFVDRPVVNDTVVSPDFFRTLLIPLKSGRLFDAYDFVRPQTTASQGVVPTKPVVVNEAFVRRVFPGEEPVGQRIVYGSDDRNSLWTIVGVVGDIRGASLGADAASSVYLCTCAGFGLFRAGFLVRTAVAPETAIRAIEQQVHALDRDQPISDVKTMDERRDATLAPERFQLILLGCFALIAILLAAAGVYGTMSYLVTSRTREIGIRIAMGARPSDVLCMVLGETTWLILFSIIAGMIGASVFTRYIRSMLYSVSELDPTTFVVTSVLLAVIVVTASARPARHAMLVDPVTALRDE